MVYSYEMRIYVAILCQASFVYVFVHFSRLFSSCSHLRILTVDGLRITSFTER